MNGLIRVGKGLVQIVPLEICEGTPSKRLAIFRTQFEGPGEIGNRLVGVALFPVDCAADHESVGILRIQANGLAGVTEGLFQIVFAAECPRASPQCVRILRLKFRAAVKSVIAFSKSSCL